MRTLLVVLLWIAAFACGLLPVFQLVNGAILFMTLGYHPSWQWWAILAVSTAIAIGWGWAASSLGKRWKVV